MFPLLSQITRPVSKQAFGSLDRVEPFHLLKTGWKNVDTFANNVSNFRCTHTHVSKQGQMYLIDYILFYLILFRDLWDTA